MRDLISLPRVKTLHPQVTDEALACLEQAEAGFPSWIAIRVVQALRTFPEQQAIFDQGRTTPGKIVTWSRPGQSFHNYGLALDFALLYDRDRNGTFETLSWDIVKDEDKDGVPDWLEVVKIFEAAGWGWGGHWTHKQDDPHLEKTLGHSWQDCLALYQAKKFIPGTNFILL